MRGLTKQQKKLLTEWANTNKDKLSFAFDLQDDSFPYELFQRLEQINDYETIVQDINRFVRDLAVPNW